MPLGNALDLQFTINQLIYANSATSVIGLATAASGVLITSGAGIPSISSTLPAAVQTNITTVGTITTGTWNGSVITGTYGGTGVNNGASTITIGGNIAFSGAFTFAGTLTGNTSVTFPTSGTLATTAGASGIVNPGLINQVAYYAAAGSTVSGLATAASGVLITSAGGVPSISSTLPSGITLVAPVLGTPASGTLTNCTGLPIAGITGLGTGVATALAANVNGSGAISLTTSPTFVTPTLGVATATSLQLGINGLLDTNGNEMLKFSATASSVNYFQVKNAATAGKPILSIIGSDTNVIGQLQGQGTGHVEIQGTTAADNATAGYIGEVISSVISNASAVSLSNNTPKDLTSISLTAGDWDVWGNINISNTVGNLGSGLAWTSTTSASAPDSSLYNGLIGTTTLSTIALGVPFQRYNFSMTTTVYISTVTAFSSGTCNMRGGIYARRVR